MNASPIKKLSFDSLSLLLDLVVRGRQNEREIYVDLSFTLADKAIAIMQAELVKLIPPAGRNSLNTSSSVFV